MDPPGEDQSQRMLSTDQTACDDDSQSRGPVPIAIVGMGMRLPGGVGSAEDFWDMLVNKRDRLSDTPESRYNAESFYHESQQRFIKTKTGYYLPDYLGKADLSLWSTPLDDPGKADPQQTLLMQVIWDCMENGGQVGWRGKEIGCYIGSFGGDWHELASKDPQGIDRTWPIATGDYALSNRVSFEYDLKGPSVTVKTACSSSLVALHDACLSIYNGECESSIVGGSSLIFTPTMTMAMSDNMVLAPDGTCKTFDAAADGFGRGEAINAIYIKRLDAAVHDHDPIRAVIRGIAANSDGRTPNISSPSQESQVDLIRKAYKHAGIGDIQETGFFECHGTGTVVGDAVETAAVAEVFGEKGVAIGSVKPNVGHGEGASGITSVIKAALALEHRVLPPNIHFVTPSPQIPFDQAHLKVPLDPTPWPEGRRERASVNAFGIGGSNAHVILDSVPATTATGQCDDQQNPKVLVVSGRSQYALDRRIDAVVEHLRLYPRSLCDLAYTLGTRRDHFAHRAFVVTGDEEVKPTMFQKMTTKRQKHPIFLFTGQAAQWPRMGRELVTNFPTFKAAIANLDQALKGLEDPPSWTIEEILAASDPNLLNQADISQSACTAIQVALVDLLAEWGMQPAKVVGHSSGEIAAAYAANAITAESAIIIAYYRGKVAASSKSTGGMLAVGCGRDEVAPFLAEGAGIGCENSPRSVTLTGDKIRLQNTLDRMLAEKPDTLHKHLPVDVAYHSEDMKLVGPEYEARIQPHLKADEMRIPMYSTLAGKPMSHSCSLHAEYWRESLVSPVLFATAVESLVKDRDNMDLFFVELGPHSALSGPLRQIMKELHLQFTYCPTIVRDADQPRSLLNTFGHAYLNGMPADFNTAKGPGNMLKDLSPYPWKNEVTGWSESRLTQAWRFRQFPHHELLGSRTLESSDLEPTWRNILRVRDNPWILQHRVSNEVVFPAAGYITIAVEAIRQITGSTECCVRHLHLKNALILQNNPDVELLTSFRSVRLTDSVESAWYEFTICSYAGGRWTRHCAGQAIPGSNQPQPNKAISPFPRAVPSDLWYQRVNDCGLDYGPRFRMLRDITASPIDHIATAAIAHEPDLYESEYALHPTVIDQCLQLLGIAACHGILYKLNGASVPLHVESVYVSPGAPTMLLEATVARTAGGQPKGYSVLTSDNRVILSMEGAAFFTLDGPDFQKGSQVPIVSHMEWRPSLDFFPLSDLLRSSAATSPHIHGVASVVLLSIIEASEQLLHCHTDEPYLTKYKNWVESEFARVQEGAYSFIPESQGWTRLDTETRLNIRNGIHDSMEGYAHFTQMYSQTMQKTWELYGEMYGGNSTVFLEYIMEGDRLKEIYEFSVSHADWKGLLSSIGHLNPQLRILEVGAGTCSATLEVLRCLKSLNGTQLFSSYTVTDISPGFLQPAKSTLAGEANVEYFTLDISQDPHKQGFESESFDLIIASNVLHATPSLRESLQNVHLLLAPGGRLLLHELCSDIPYTNLIMGLLPGWWFGENDDRAREPFVSPDRWDKELQGAGFNGVEALAYDIPPPYEVTATMMSRKDNQYPLGQRITFVGHSTTQMDPWAQVVEQRFRQEGYIVEWSTIGEQNVARDTISFLDLDGPFFHDILEEDYAQFMGLLSSAENVLWVTKSVQIECDDPWYNLVLGVARTARTEELANFGTLEVGEFDDAAADALAMVFRKSQQQKRNKDWQWKYHEFALHDGIIHVGRLHWNRVDDHLLAPVSETSPRALAIGTYGVLETIRWVQKRLGPLKPNEVEISMKYVGLNFKDIMVALGVVDTKEHLGMEGSGVVTKVGSDVQDLRVGDGVLVSHTGLFGTTIIAPAARCIPIPEGFSFDSGAAMPCVYATAIYSLAMVANLQKHQSVLIHSACGGVGLAAIDVCKMIGAEIYTTVGNEEKVQYLVNTVGIPRHRIFHSRDSSFVTDVLRETDGRGVDIVLDSSSGDLLQASWRVVAKMGKMIEIGKRDFLEHGKLDMEMFQSNRSFHGVDLLELSRDDPGTIRQIFEMVAEWSQQGHMRPTLPLTVFEAADVEKAFRYMQKGVHIGKVVVKMPEDSNTLPTASEQAEVSFRPDAHYLLVGGLGGIGRTVATWMILNGARSLIFLSRTAGETDSDQAFLRELEHLGCVANTVAGDVANMEDVERAVAMGPVAGVVQMSLVLRDQLLTKMSHDDWTSVLAPKVDGTWNLHRALLDSQLDFFLLFGSLSGWRGNSGQGNYAAASTFLDSFAQYRRMLGLPASVVTLGPVQGIGRVSNDARLLQALRSRGIYLLTEGDLLNGITLALGQKRAEPSDGCLIPGDFGLGMVSTQPKHEVDIAYLQRDARFGTYLNVQSSAPQRENASSDSVLQEIHIAITNDPSLLDQAECRHDIARELGKQVNMYSSSGEDLSDEDLANLHIDSLMSLEIRHFLRRSFNVDISLMEISNAGTAGQLSEVIIKALKAKLGDGAIEAVPVD